MQPIRMIDHTQLHIARRSLDLSMERLAALSGLSASAISQIERSGEFRAATMRSLKAKGAIFGADGSVGVNCQWEGGRPRDPQVRASVLAVLNSARKARGQAPFVDRD